jgi:Helix-turn-helix
MRRKRDESSRDGLDPAAFVLREMRNLHSLCLMDSDKPKPVSAPGRGYTNPAAVARVVAYMAEHGLTQVEFAERVGIGERTLRRLLLNHPAGKRTWTDVAEAMGIPLEDLLETGH